MKLLFPIDWIAADKFDKNAATKEVGEDEGIPDDWMGPKMNFLDLWTTNY